MVKKSKLGIGRLGCLTTVIGALLYVGTVFVISKVPALQESQAVTSFAIICFLVFVMGAGIVMMIIGFFKRMRERSEDAEAERISRIARKVEEKMGNNE